ncbi:MAG: glycosyltransferase family 9 protein [Chlamydiae bacterium]|nr:glycosyltransferase family 9 protein [Chlamydiota bacterium]
MKNHLIKWCLKLFRLGKRSSPRFKTQEKFLIVSTTGLGDTLWATPSIRALRQTFPSSYIAILTSEIGDEILENNPHIDDLFAVSDPPLISLLSFFPILKRKKVDYIFIFHASQRLVILFCALLNAPNVIGTAHLNKGLDFILTACLPQKFQHEIERRLDQIATIHAKTDDFSLEFHINEKEEDHAKKFLENYQIPPATPLVGLHPGAKNLFKQWDPHSFIELGKKLQETLKCQILISGDEEEALLVFEIASRIPNAIPIAGELPLPVFGSILKKMALFITNDTGPMHIAFAVKTPTIALFCPTDPKICGPYQVEDAIILQRSKTCHPCIMKKCEDPFCLLQIGPEEVYQKALNLFEKRKIHASKA